jgi:hypothetical protein
MYKIIIVFLLLINLTACNQESGKADPEHEVSLSETMPMKQQQQGPDAAGVQFNQPSTQFKSLSEAEPQQ